MRVNVCLAAFLSLGTFVLDAAPPARAFEDETRPPAAKIAPWLEAHLLRDGPDSFLVLFDTREGLAAALAPVARSPLRARATYDVLRNRSRASQAGVRALLEAQAIPFRSLYLINGLQVRGDLRLARELAQRPEVVRIVGDPAVRGIEADAGTDATEPDSGPEWGVQAIRADDVWAQDGSRGFGIVVASADTGVEWTHAALRDHYRGWNGVTASHDYNWYDAVENLPEPLDDNDHGTHTTGTMVGDDGSGNQIGVAPQATWVACRNMDHGTGRPSTYLDCMQYFIAPWPHGGDPELDGDPDQAPHVVNNSWGCPASEGCDPDSLAGGVASVRAAGILFVAAAGNSGPFCSSVSDPPAIYEDSFVAGATNASNGLALFSSKGPVSADGSGRIKPDVAAPGEGVRSSVRGNAYASFSGTSMASPHTAGAAALLWSVKPQVLGLIRISRCLLSRSANPAVQNQWPTQCGGTGKAVRPNNLFGWGLVDAYNAIHLGPDGDVDGIADPCDCASTDAGAYDPPGEVSGVVHDAGRVRIGWDPQSRQAGNGTVYDVLRGDLGDLRSSGTIAAAWCLATGTAGTFFDDPAPPEAGAGFYYEVQARNACGTGGYGTDSAGNARVHAPCP